MASRCLCGRYKTVCQYYGVECYDLRNANIDKTRDMCSADYLHVNISGNEKLLIIWKMGMQN